LRWFAIAFVVFQLGVGVLRIPAAASPDGIHYAAPYPSITLPRFKQDFGWDLTALDTRLNTKKQKVLILPMDPWPETYLMIYLYAHGIAFAKATTVNSYFGAGRDLGQMSMAAPDVEIGAERTAFVLHFRDGVPDVRVKSRPD
jgi:hypothetical protein